MLRICQLPLKGGAQYSLPPLRGRCHRKVTEGGDKKSWTNLNLLKKSLQKKSPSTMNPFCLAEMKRFELLRRYSRPTAFRVRTLQPLGYISKNYLIILSKHYFVVNKKTVGEYLLFLFYIWSLYLSAVMIPSSTFNLQILAFRASKALALRPSS